MPDVLIKNVPAGAEDAVKNMAMVAIERYMKQRAPIIDAVEAKKFEDAVDTIRTDNNLDAKFTIIQAEPIEEPIEEVTP